MSANPHKPHILVLPEDNANREIAVGFSNHLRQNHRQMQILPVAGGWDKLRKKFKAEYIEAMLAFPMRYMVLLVDFDRRTVRYNEILKVVPESLQHRVFILGVFWKPEKLKRQRPYEAIGKDLARDCEDGTQNHWNDELLQHNLPELNRLPPAIREILFASD